jgi:hypothetical protein
MEGEDTRTFERDGERYTVEVWRHDDGVAEEWAYRVESDRRGVLDSGPLDGDDPWAQVGRMFPELRTYP